MGLLKICRWIAPLLVCPCVGHAALTWETRRIEIDAKAEDTRAVAVFRFANRGSAPVSITTVKAACDCTTTELHKLTYRPGETGEIGVVFAFGGAVGVQEKTIQVETDDAPGRSEVLTLHVTIPELLAYAPRLLLWRATEPLTEKSVLVTNQGTARITAIEMDPAARATAEIRVVSLVEGEKYRLLVKPTTLDDRGSHRVPLTVTFQGGTSRPLVVFVVIK